MECLVELQCRTRGTETRVVPEQFRVPLKSCVPFRDREVPNLSLSLGGCLDVRFLCYTRCHFPDLFCSTGTPTPVLPQLPWPVGPHHPCPGPPPPRPRRYLGPLCRVSPYPSKKDGDPLCLSGRLEPCHSCPPSPDPGLVTKRGKTPRT